MGKRGTGRRPVSVGLSVCLSVCLSVTLMSCIQTAKDSIKHFSRLLMPLT